MKADTDGAKSHTVFLIRTLWSTGYTNPHLPPPKAVHILTSEAHEGYSALERDSVNAIKGTDLEVGKLSWIVQVDPILHEPLRIEGSFLAAARKGQKDATLLAKARGKEAGASD